MPTMMPLKDLIYKATSVFVGLVVLAACGPSDAEIENAHNQLTAYIDDLDWSKYHGYYKMSQLRYFDMQNTAADRPGRFAILLLQEDDDPNQPRQKAPANIATFPKPFYQREFCPPPDVMERIGDQFSVTIQILSRRYDRYQTVFCNTDP